MGVASVRKPTPFAKPQGVPPKLYHYPLTLAARVGGHSGARLVYKTEYDWSVLVAACGGWFAVRNPLVWSSA
jgi:hypothetical protein